MPFTRQAPGLVALYDSLYTMANNGTAYKYLGSKNWKTIDGIGAVSRQIAVTRNHAYIVNAQNDIIAYKRSDDTTKIIDRSPEPKVIASSAKFVYKLHLDQHRIYQYSGKDWNLVDDGVQATAIAVDEDDTLYQLHKDGRISKYLGSEGWQEIDSTPNINTIVAGGGKLYKFHKDGGVYVHVEDYDWDRIDKSGETFEIAAGRAGVFQKRTDSSLWQYDESAKKWDRINGDMPKGVVYIAVGDTIYMRYLATSEIYQRDLNAKSWVRIN